MYIRQTQNDPPCPCKEGIWIETLSSSNNEASSHRALSPQTCIGTDTLSGPQEGPGSRCHSGFPVFPVTPCRKTCIEHSQLCNSYAAVQGSSWWQLWRPQRESAVKEGYISSLCGSPDPLHGPSHMPGPSSKYPKCLC